MSADLAMGARAAFAARFQTVPEVLAFAPGRVNLMGDHTDYQGGLSLPIALEAGVAAAASPAPDVLWHLAAEGHPAAPPLDPSEVAPDHPAFGARPWLRYVAGTLRELGLQAGLRLVLVSNLPEGSGLSSSAAVELATALAALAALGLDRREPLELCLAAQRAEHRFAGVPCGLMDQLASLFGRARHAVRVDSAEGGAQPVPFDPDADGFALYILDAGVPRTLAGSGYRTRRQEVEAAAARLGVDRLSRLTVGDLASAESALEPVLAARVRHVVRESARVDAVLEAAGRRDWAAVGALFLASHASLRDDYDSSHAALDVVQASLGEAGEPVFSRVTGGGFGGSLVALARPDALDAGVERATAALAATGLGDGRAIRAERVRPADGARLLVVP